MAAAVQTFGDNVIETERLRGEQVENDQRIVARHHDGWTRMTGTCRFVFGSRGSYVAAFDRLRHFLDQHIRNVSIL